jgi:hypothetical protein
MYKCAFVDLCMNDTVTLTHGVGQTNCKSLCYFLHTCRISCYSLSLDFILRYFLKYKIITHNTQGLTWNNNYCYVQKNVRNKEQDCQPKTLNYCVELIIFVSSVIFTSLVFHNVSH